MCVEVEPRDRLLGGEDLVVAMAPAEPRQVVAHAPRAGSPWRGRPRRPSAPWRLDSLAPSGPWISGMWAMTGTVQPMRLVDLRLARGVGQVVVAADDVGHAHVVVVDHDGEHVGRRAVGAQQMKSSRSSFCQVTRPCTRSSTTVSPSRGALRRIDAARRRRGASRGSRSRQRPS